MVRNDGMGYINGINDAGYELMNEKDWIDYIMDTLDLDAGSDQMVNGLEFKHIYFYGKEKIKKLAIEYLKSDDVIEYVLQ